LPSRFYEDFEVGQSTATDQDYLVTREEIIEFATKWDPQPFHIDEEAAKASQFKGLTAAGMHLLAIAGRLWHQIEGKPVAIAALEWDEILFLKPVRPNDRLSIRVTCTHKRASESKSDRGIIHTLITLTNQGGDIVLSFRDKILVSRKAPLTPSSGS